MEYHKKVTLKDGRECILRNGTEDDAHEVLDIFNLTHAETDFLLSYPDENSFDVKQEGEFLRAKTESDNEIEIVAVIDGRIAGTAGITAVGSRYKVKHRADFGIGIAKEFWGLGIGRALTEACIECARKAGYTSLSLRLWHRILTPLRSIKMSDLRNTAETPGASIRGQTDIGSLSI